MVRMAATAASGGGTLTYAEWGPIRDLHAYKSENKARLAPQKGCRKRGSTEISAVCGANSVREPDPKPSRPEAIRQILAART